MTSSKTKSRCNHYMICLSRFFYYLPNTHMTKIQNYDFMAPKVKAITAERAQLLKRCKRTADTKFIAAKKPKKFTDVKLATLTTTNKQQDEIKL